MNHVFQEIERPSIILFFTWDVSLALWKEKGLLEREIRYYEALTKEGIKVTFLTWGGKKDVEIANSHLKNIDVIPFYSQIPRPKNKILRIFVSLLAPWVARSAIKKSDLLKTNQMWGGWCAVLAKILFRKPLLVRTGFELYKFTVAQGHKTFRRTFIFLLSKMTYASADLIYVSADGDKAFIENSFKAPSSKIEVRPNWIDTSVFLPPSEPRKKNEILFVGRLTKQKNLPLLFTALENSSWTLNIIGNGELMSELQNIATHKKIRTNFLGSVPNDKLPKFYKECSVFVLPSFYEGNPKTLLEAMSCGCAVVGTDVDGINNVIQNGENGILCDLTPHSMQQAISKLANDTGVSEQLGKAASKRIQTTQGLRTLVGKEISDYEKVFKMK